MLLFAYLRSLSEELSLFSPSPYLDAELLLSHSLGLTRAQLHSEGSNYFLTELEIKRVKSYLNRRKAGEPMAYLLGYKEFWSLSLEVSPEVLVPRPETEILVEQLLKLFSNEKRDIVDLGTGSAAIALSLAIERPLWRIVATDYSSLALRVAERNIHRYGIKTVYLRQGDWCQALYGSERFDAILSNPPYISINDPHLKSELALSFEPRIALIGGEDGLHHLKRIIDQARYYLLKGGYLFLEHASDQADSVEQLFLNYGYHHIEKYRDLSAYFRVSSGKWN